MRAGPAASVVDDDPWWGSHFSQSHSDADDPSTTATTDTSDGPWNTASWQTIARTNARAAAVSPSTTTTACSEKSTVTGNSATADRSASSRCSAPCVTGSCAPGSPSSGATSGVESGC